MSKGILKLLSHCIMLTLSSSHAAGLLQVVWKSFNGGLAFLQAFGHWPHPEPGHRSGRAGAQSCTKCLVCLCHVLCLASVFRSVVRMKFFPLLRLQSTLVMCFLTFLGIYHLMWWASPLTKLYWAPFLHQEQDIGNASAPPCCLHLPCENYHFWSFLLGIKFLGGFWEVLFCLGWTAAWRKNVWEPEKYIYYNISCWLQRTRLSSHVRVQGSQRGLCPSFLDFSHTCPDSGFAHTCFVPVCTVRQLQLSYCCAVTDLRIISEHIHTLSSSDSIETFKPGCGQFLSWDSGRQGDEVVKRKHWHHMEIKFPSFEIQHSNSHLLKWGIQRSFSDLELSLAVIPKLWF